MSLDPASGRCEEGSLEAASLEGFMTAFGGLLGARMVTAVLVASEGDGEPDLIAWVDTEGATKGQGGCWTDGSGPRMFPGRALFTGARGDEVTSVPFDAGEVARRVTSYAATIEFEPPLEEGRPACVARAVLRRTRHG